jgi:hypothetical protein
LPQFTGLAIMTETECVIFAIDPLLPDHPGLLGGLDEDGYYTSSFSSLNRAKEYAEERRKRYGGQVFAVKVGSPRYRKLMRQVCRPAK